MIKIFGLIALLALLGTVPAFAQMHGGFHGGPGGFHGDWHGGYGGFHPHPDYNPGIVGGILGGLFGGGYNYQNDPCWRWNGVAWYRIC